MKLTHIKTKMNKEVEIDFKPPVVVKAKSTPGKVESQKEKENVCYLVRTKTIRREDLMRSAKKLKILRKILKLKTNLKRAKKTSNSDSHANSL